MRQYCEAYGFAGGIAEFGAVFIDAVQRREIPLIDSSGSKELERCRDVIRQMPGVFMDPGYEYAIRVYRYKGHSTVGLKPEEVRSLLKPRNARSSISREVRTPTSFKSGRTKASPLDL